MRKGVYLSDDLKKEIESHLDFNDSWSGFLREAAKEKLARETDYEVKDERAVRQYRR